LAAVFRHFLEGKNVNCQLGTILGWDGDSGRANDLGDGRVGCIFHGITAPSTVEALTRAGGGCRLVVEVQQGFSLTEFATARLHGFDRAKFPYAVRIAVTYDERFTQAVLVFPRNFTEHLLELEEPDASLGRDFNPGEFPGAPQSIIEAATRLHALGYRVAGPPEGPVINSLFGITMKRGCGFLVELRYAR
jgi:hypothetical protein